MAFAFRRVDARLFLASRTLGRDGVACVFTSLSPSWEKVLVRRSSIGPVAVSQTMGDDNCARWKRILFWLVDRVFFLGA